MMHTKLGSVWLSSWPLPGLSSGSWKLMLPDKGPEPWLQRVVQGPVGPSWPAQALGKCV